MGIFIAIAVAAALGLLLVFASVLFGVFMLLALVVTVGYALCGLYVCYSRLLRRMQVRRVGNRARL
jgi:predicted membrane protein